MSSHSWENQNWDYWNADSDHDAMSEQEKGAHEFTELLLEQYFAGVMTAQVFCLLCYWASAGGLVGEAAARYGLPPGKQSGKYKWHLDEKLHFKSQRQFMYHFARASETL